MLRILRSVLADLARLKLPVTAAAVVATALALLAPFGVELGAEQTAQVTAAIAAFGVLATVAQRYLGTGVPSDVPPTTSTAGIVPPSEVASAEPGSSPAQPG